LIVSCRADGCAVFKTMRGGSAKSASANRSCGSPSTTWLRVSRFDEALHLAAWNRNFQELFQLPDEFLDEQHDFDTNPGSFTRPIPRRRSSACGYGSAILTALSEPARTAQ